MKYYKDNKNNVFSYESDGSQDDYIGDKVAMTAEEVEAYINPPKTQEEVLLEYKTIKDTAVSNRLAAHRYDSLATVKLWADDATFGAEATQILNWYKALALMSIQLENSVLDTINPIPIPTKEEYQAMVDSVVF